MVNLSSDSGRSGRMSQTRKRDVLRSLLLEGLERRDLMATDAAGPIFAPGTDPAYVQEWIDRLAGRGTGSGSGAAAAARSAPINLPGERWTNPTGGSSPNEGDPATVSWSIVPDGTLFGNGVGGTGNSDLVAYMDSIYGSSAGPLSNRPWFHFFSDNYDRWAALSGLTYVYEANDDGVPLDVANRGVLGTRGDVRISGRNIDGNSNILAFNFFPNVGGNDGLDGDMVIDTADNFFQNTSQNSLGLFNVLMHESGHGLGLGHVIPVNQTKLMEPFVSFAYRGPQHDDILGAQTLYGDDKEQPNDPQVNLGFFTNAKQTFSNLSIDRNNDTDLYRFQAESKGRLSVKVTPVGQQYTVGPQGGFTGPVNTLINQNLSFELLDGLGTILASANATPAGQLEQIVRFAIPTGGNYQIRVKGSPGETQLYDLEVTGAGFVVNGIAPEPPRLLSIAPNSGQLLDPNVGNVASANVLSVSPRELVFRFNGSQAIDDQSLTGIRITRSGGDDDFSNGSILVTPNFLDLDESTRIVIARFGEPLPDDRYKIEVLGVSVDGLPAIQNTDEQALRPRFAGTDRDTYYMNLELGAKIVAVVPQPISRANNGSLVQNRKSIEVYFNNDDLSKTSAENPAFYKLILTRDSVNPGDDQVFMPASVTYDAVADKAVLTFATEIDLLGGGNGTFRLRVGSNRNPITVTPNVTSLSVDTGDTLIAASTLLGTLSGPVSHIINEQIVATPASQLLLNYPGSNSEIGSRDIQDQQQLRLDADTNPYTTTRYYSFLQDRPYAQDGQGRPVNTAISDIQRQRVREVFEFYSQKLGIQFIETTGLLGPDGSSTLQVVVGDLLSGIIGDPGGPGGYVSITTLDSLSNPSLAILDGSESWDNDFGFGTQPDNSKNPLTIEIGRTTLLQQLPSIPPDLRGPNFFIEAMRAVGLLLGLGQTHDLPPGTIQGSEPTLGRAENPVEQIFPGDLDVVHGQHLYRPDNRDVDIYRFLVQPGQRGTIAIEAFSERLADSSNLDTYLKLFKRNTLTGVVELVSANDNYFSHDSLIRTEVTGEVNVEFFIAVSARGNENYDPKIQGSGSGGLSDGRYQIRFDYQPTSSALDTLVDTSGTILDGDGDGIAGGEFNFWFRAVSPKGIAAVGAPKTIFVDKDFTGVVRNGSLTNPFTNIPSAVADALSGDTIRLVGSEGVDRNIATVLDNPAYEIGDGGPGIGLLSDGRDLKLPKGVSLVIDAGAILKLSASEVLVGSEISTTDRGGASIQVLGTPTRSVYFTSYLDESLGRDTSSLKTTPQRGNWGGIEIRNDVAREQGRSDPELKGVFLNYIAMADIRYGGGSVGQGTTSHVVSPIHLTAARPTLLHNRISQSADAGISADPSSFEETLFTENRYQHTGAFTPDYNRVGPVLRGNRITTSSTNGLFIRVDTLAGQTLTTLDVAARLDDTDIVYVLGENLVINGTPGGSILDTGRPDVETVQAKTIAGGNLTVGQSYSYRFANVDRFGQQGLTSNPTITLFPAGLNRSIQLDVLPAAVNDFVGRRLYRSGLNGTWDLIAELDRNSSSFTDLGGPVIAAGVGLAPASSQLLFDTTLPDASTVLTAPLLNGSLRPDQLYSYRLAYVDSNGKERLAGSTTLPVLTDKLNLTINLFNLPTSTSGFARKLYRSSPNALGRWDLVANLDATTTFFTDTGNSLATGFTLSETTSQHRARPDGSLVVDPGVIVKSQGARIEVGMGAQLIAEGTPTLPIIFTSRSDDRYGAGATFDTNQDGASLGSPGNWSGIFASHLSTLSIDSARIAFAGGDSRIPGGFASFNAIEIHQAEARIVNSIIEDNESGAATTGTTRRAARGVNDAAAIYVSGSQPIIVNNIIRNNSKIESGLLLSTSQNGETAAISVDANSLKAVPKLDYGRSTGLSQQIDTGSGNLGPLVSGNRLGGNAINGMRVRGATMTTEGVWDDTDIVHVLQKEIVIPDFHSYGGLRLQSHGNESLVVKLGGVNAGFTAMGRPLDITDRIGGSLLIIGTPGFPVVLTSLADDTIGAGFSSSGGASLDTNNDGSSTVATPGSWRSIRLDSYSNDRNVETNVESEPDEIGVDGTNNIPANAEEIGSLAPTLESGDENIRLGITLAGTIASPSDLDVYRFNATAGSSVWFDIDRTSANLDTVVELLAADGTIIAQSNNSFDESILGKVYFSPDRNLIDPGTAFPLDQGRIPERNANAPSVQVDFQGTNPLDAGFRVTLPGSAGAKTSYYVRVRSSNVAAGDPNPALRLLDTSKVKEGLTAGAYRLQIRLQQTDEVAGSTIRYSDIRYATNGIEATGLPLHSPLLGELSESNQEEVGSNPVIDSIVLGNLFNYDRGAASVAGKIASVADVDWFRFTINRQLSTDLYSDKHQSVIFDIDYADGLGRPDTSLWVFRANAAGNPTQLVLIGRDSDITDDKAAANRGADAGDITRGSFGSGDAFIGASELPTGEYIVAVTNNSLTADLLEGYTIANPANPLVRFEPLDSVQRLAEDHFETISPLSSLASTAKPPKQVAFPVGPRGGTTPYVNAVPYTLADVTAYVVRDSPTTANRSQLLYGNARTAAKEAQGSTIARLVDDLAVAPDGNIAYAVTPSTTVLSTDANTGVFINMQADGTLGATTNAGIQTFETVPNGAAFTTRQVRQGNANTGIGTTFTGLTYADDGVILTMFGVAQRGSDFSFSGTGQPFDEAIIVPGAGGVATQIGISPNTGIARNILYRLNPDTQDAISPTSVNLGDRTGDGQATGTGTQVREYGIFADLIEYTRRNNGFADVIVPRREAAGDIIGIAEIGNFLYGLTDQGELWRIQSGGGNSTYANGFTTVSGPNGTVALGADLIATNLPAGLTGLSKGPRNITLPQSKTEYILDSSWRVTQGTFTLRYRGVDTSSLNFNATADDIRVALEAIPSIGVGNVQVKGGPLDKSPISISFVGTLTGSNFAVAIGTQNLMETTVPVATLVQNQFPNELFQLTVPRAPLVTGGTYSLMYGVDPAITLPFNATAFQIRNAILASPSIVAANAATAGSITVTVTNFGTGKFSIFFAGTLFPGNTAPPIFNLTASNLTSTPIAIPATITRQVNTAYSSILFGVAPNGTMHAFDINGLPQGLFTDGQSSTITDNLGTFTGTYDDGLSIFGSFGNDVKGIDFGAIDVNLWHVSGERTADAGHGILQDFNLSRSASQNAGSSLYFGFRDNASTTGRQPGTWAGIYDLVGGNATLDKTYNLPGGAHGAVESNPIDLTGYTPDDQPTLYFNYFAETQNSNSSLSDNAIMQDAFRVYGYGPDGRWILLGTNNSASNQDTRIPGQFAGLNDEFDVPASGYQDSLGRSYRTQELFDQNAAGATGWRQARINLAPLAGFQDARLRFEFSTDGDFRTGDPLRGGIELTAVSGDRIKQGDTFSLQVPVDPFTFPTPVPTPIPFVFDVNGSTLQSANGNVIFVNASMTAAQVRDQVRLALARVLNGDKTGLENILPYPVYQDTVRIYNYEVVDDGPLHATTNRGADKFGPYSTILTNFDPVTGLIIPGDIDGIKNFPAAFRTAQANNFEGIYVDDIIIGFAERGEQVLASPINGGANFDVTPFYETLGGPLGVATTQTEVGTYQLEIRTAMEYGDQGTSALTLFRAFDTNERLSQQVALIVSQQKDILGVDVSPVKDGDTFTINDGLREVTYEIDIRINITDLSTVGIGRIPVPVVLPYGSAKANSGIVATAIRDAINGPTSQAILKVTAGLRGQFRNGSNVDIYRDASNIVELFIDPSLPGGASIFSIAPALSDAFDPNPLDPFGLQPILYPPIQVAGVYVYGKEGTYNLTGISSSFNSIHFGEDLGDSNRYRDQGQVVISSNSISHSSQRGIVVDAGVALRPDLIVPEFARNAAPRPAPGSVRNLVTLNTENLAPGVVVVNNVVSSNVVGGILVSGAGAANNIPPFTMARIYNNTIFGGDAPTGTGISVNQNASPILLNNILAGNNQGISAAGTTTVAGGNLYYNNSNTTNVIGETFGIFLNPTDPLFVNTSNGRFYLKDQSQAIDSSLGSLQERPGLSSVKSGIKRTPNPLIAPSRDVSGLLRQDDPNVSTPGGQGQNVFIDRGAVDRTDFKGPIAILTRPLDDAEGTDLDRRSITNPDEVPPPNSYVKLKPGTSPLNFFEILLDENLGIGPEPLTVQDLNILLTENGRLLAPGQDYEFGYSVNSRTIRLTPLAGFWRQDSVYEITLNNQPRLRINATGGETLIDGTQLTATLPNGLPITLEYETGFALQVPQTSTLVVPSLGSLPSGVTDGQTFSISYGLLPISIVTVVFELDTDNFVTGTNTKVSIPSNASPTAVRDAILSVLLSPAAAVLQLNPKAVGTSEIHLGTGPNHSVSVAASNLVLNGNLSGVEDGQIFKYRSGSNAEVVFEFNSNGLPVAAGNREILFTRRDTFDDLASKVAQALSTVVTGPTPVRNVARGIVHVGGQLGDNLDLSLSALRLLGSPGVSGKLQLQVPAGGASFIDGQTFSIQTASGTTTFEFTKDLIVTPTNRGISISDVDSSATVAGKTVAALVAANLGFVPTLSGSTIALNEPLGTNFNIQTTPFVVTGVAGGALSVPVIPAIDFTAEMVAGQIAKALNSLTGTLFPSIHAIGIGGRSLVIDGLTSMTNIQSVLLPAIVDLAGNPLQANRPSGLTQFTIAMPDAKCDFGDATTSATTLLGDDGARHVLFPADEATLVLGALVDSESDAQPNALANGDDLNGASDDEDGIRFTGYFNSNSPAVSIDATVIGVGYLDAWIDWNGDGDFLDTQEKIIDSQPVISGRQRFAVTVPSFASPGDRNARFRLSSTGGLFAGGMAVGGEVEDYSVRIIGGFPPVAVDDVGANYTVIEDPINPLTVVAPGILGNDSDPDAGQTSTLTVFDSDPNTLGIQPNSGPSNGVLTLNADGSFQYVPKANFSGIDSFTYFAVDSLGLGSVTPATVTITVTPINDAPEFSLPSTSLSFTEDQGADSAGNPATMVIPNFATGIRPGPAGSNSEDSQVLTFKLVANDPTLFAVQPSIALDGTLTFTLARDRNSNFAGFDGRVRVTLVDDGLNTAPNVNTSSVATFTISLTAANDPPVLDGYFATVDEDSTTTFTSLSVLEGDLPGPATALDEAGQTVSIIAIASTSANGGVVTPFFAGLNVNTFNYTPAANFFGTDTITYTVSDNVAGSPLTTVGTITITVRPLNDPPIFTIPASIDVFEDQGSIVGPGATQTQVPISLANFATGISSGPVGSSDEIGQSVSFEVVALEPSFFQVQPVLNVNPNNLSEATLTFTLAPHRNLAFPNGLRNRIQIIAHDNGNGTLPNVNTSAPAFMLINIIQVNDPPVPGVFAPTVAEESATFFQSSAVLAVALQGPVEAIDELDQVLTITQLPQRSTKGGVVNPVFTGNVITSFRYIAPTNFVGIDTFAYTVTDNGVSPLSSVGTITITVTAVNDAPEFAVGPDVTVIEDFGAYSKQWIPLNNLVPPSPMVAAGPINAFDELIGPNAQTVSFNVTADKPNLFSQQPAISSTGVLSFTPAKDANGVVVIRVFAVDSGSGIAPNVNRSATVSFTINLTPINDEPAFTTGGNVTVNEDSGDFNQVWATGIQPAAGLLSSPQTASDESGQTISFVIPPNSNPGLFSTQPAIAADGKLSFKLATNKNGFAVVTVVARDSGLSTNPDDNESEIKTFTINVSAVNDPPVGVDDSYTTTEDASLTSTANNILVNDSEPDGDSFFVVAGNATSARGATVLLRADGTFEYDPRSAISLQAMSAGQVLTDTFTYRLQDSTGSQSSLTSVTITVSGINDVPIAVNDEFFVVPDTTTNLDVLRNDIDPDSSFNFATMQLGILASNGTVGILSNGQLSYTPNSGFRGTDTFSYRISDTTGLRSNEATVVIRVNRTPLALPDTAMVLANSSVVINVLANDTDPDGNSTINSGSVTIVSLPNNGTATVQNNGSVLFVPSTDFKGTSTFSYTIRDDKNAVSAPASVTVRVVQSIYQNPNNRYDVNNDGFVSPIDALIVINDIQRRGSRVLSPTEFVPPPYIDVDGSSSVEPIDVLLVINYLNRQSRGSSGEGEARRLVGAATPAVAMASMTTQTDVMMVTHEQVISAVANQVAQQVRHAVVAAAIAADAIDESNADESMVQSLTSSTGGKKRSQQTDLAFANSIDDPWEM